MPGFLTVGEGETPSEHAGEGESTDFAAMDAAMMESILEFPAVTEGGKAISRSNRPSSPTGPSSSRSDDGDRISVVVNNELPMGTDVHFHGIKLKNAMDGVSPLTQPLIEPGQSFTYEFVAEAPAVAMYHAHAQLQVPNGLFGTIIIGDLPLPTGRTIGGIEVPSDVEPVTEIPMVLNDAGSIRLSTQRKVVPGHRVARREARRLVRVHYYNEGLQVHPSHLHGFPQLVFTKDGFPFDQPYWVDTLNVAPGERYSILVRANEAGTWVWHCHILNHVEGEDGMFGMVTAVIVEG